MTWTLCCNISDGRPNNRNDDYKMSNMLNERSYTVLLFWCPAILQADLEQPSRIEDELHVHVYVQTMSTFLFLKYSGGPCWLQFKLTTLSVKFNQWKMCHYVCWFLKVQSVLWLVLENSHLFHWTFMGEKDHQISPKTICM